MLSNVFVPKIIEASNEEQVQKDNNIRKKIASSSSNFRDILCDTGIISGASGSAFISFGDTKVFCAIYGPRANQRGTVNGQFSDSGILECDVRISTANSHALSSSADPRISQQLRDALIPSVRLSCYPKAIISVYAVVVQSGGSELSAVITCASLALADASIELNDFVCATTVGLSKSTNEKEIQNFLTLDPSIDQYQDLLAVLSLSSMVSYSELTHISVEGSLTFAEFDTLVQLASSGCEYLRTVLKESIKKRQLKHEEKL